MDFSTENKKKCVVFSKRNVQKRNLRRTHQQSMQYHEHSKWQPCQRNFEYIQHPPLEKKEKNGFE